MGILHLLSFTLPLCHIPFQSKDHRRGWGKKNKSQYKTVPYPLEALVPEQIRGTMVALLSNIMVGQYSSGHLPSYKSEATTRVLPESIELWQTCEVSNEHRRAPPKAVRVKEVLPHAEVQLRTRERSLSVNLIWWQFNEDRKLPFLRNSNQWSCQILCWRPWKTYICML